LNTVVPGAVKGGRESLGSNGQLESVVNEIINDI